MSIEFIRTDTRTRTRIRIRNRNRVRTRSAAHAQNVFLWHSILYKRSKGYGAIG